MLSLLLVFGLACWCWFGRGPRFLRWPLVVIFLLIQSGNPIGNVVSAWIGALSGPLLQLLIVVIGIMIMFRGLGWRSRRRDYREGGRNRDRW